jgi:hypothetical protein
MWPSTVPNTKAPFGGQGTGRNPTDRGKQGWKWSIAADRHGIPLGWAIDGANRHDTILLEPTLDTVAAARTLERQPRVVPPALQHRSGTIDDPVGMDPASGRPGALHLSDERPTVERSQLHAPPVAT